MVLSADQVVKQQQQQLPSQRRMLIANKNSTYNLDAQSTPLLNHVERSGNNTDKFTGKDLSSARM